MEPTEEKKLSLYQRMKDYYESVTDGKLPRRTHTIIRADGVGFSNFTKGFNFPYDNHFINCMNEAAIALCQRAQGAKFAFVQSDEISIVLSDYDTLNTTPWYAGKERKLNSVSAGITTAAFAKALIGTGYDLEENDFPFFDARAFTIPYLDEVVNYFLNRQQDCTRNSLSSVAQSLYSHEELKYKGQNELQEMIFQKGEQLKEKMWSASTINQSTYEKPDFNWNDIDPGMKRGRLIVNETYQIPYHGIDGQNNEAALVTRNRWVAKPAPMFGSPETREYLKSFFIPQE